MELAEKYKGFEIIPDKMLGYSLIDRKGNWAKSDTSTDRLKEVIKQILKNETHRNART